MTATTTRFATIAALAATIFAAIAFQVGQASATTDTTTAHQSVAVDPAMAAVALVLAAIVMVVALVGMRRN